MKINKAYSILGLIKRNFIYLDKDIFIMLYKSLVRPHANWCGCGHPTKKETGGQSFHFSRTV